MHFKNPELLYALVLLVIPILIHLFQLRRFQKVQFTNVKLLKQITLQTRKSSQLKKWLVLLTRLLTIACAVIAFAQPFIPSTENYNASQETVIYLDNSFSMQANGKNGSLLNEAIQGVLSSLPENEELSLFTNDNSFKATTLKAIKNELIGLPYSTEQLSYEGVLLKGSKLFSKNKNATKNLVLISDFQQKGEVFNVPEDSITNIKLVKQQPNTITNVSIDSVYIKASNAETLDLAVILKSFGPTQNDVSVSLFNNDLLLAKNTATFLNASSEVIFTIPNNTEMEGKVSIEDVGLAYDNTFYFNLNKKEKIKVLAIYDDITDDFLNRIYTDDEFEFLSYSLNELNFNLIPNQNLVILNELEIISDALKSALIAFKKDGGSVCIIPSDIIDLNSYNQLLNDFNNSSYATLNPISKRITQINFEHPLLDNTFYAKVSNFQYPKTDINYTLLNKGNTILSYENNDTFLNGNDKLYTFAAPINSINSNFANSQLIVPIFYNMGLQSLPLPELYYNISTDNKIAIKTTLGQDDILSLVSESSTVIPMQNTFSTSVVIQTDEFPKKAGIINVNNKEESLQKLSFNYPRSESNLVYLDLNTISDASVDSSFNAAIESIKSNSNVNALWKWFVIFALVFLIIEMLLLKYLK